MTATPFFSSLKCDIYPNRILIVCRLLIAVTLSLFVVNQAEAVDFSANTPAIKELRQSLKQRHSQLRPYLNNGAIGLANNGLITLRDAKMIPLSDRQSINRLIAADNQDRNALYREIALANNHPEWENEIRTTFSERWVSWAQSGWWYQKPDGSWHKK